MIRSAFTQYRELILPRNFNTEDVLGRVGEHIYGTDFYEREPVIDLLDELSDAALYEALRRNAPHASREQLEEAVDRTYRGADAGDPTMRRVLQTYSQMVGQSLQTYLQIVSGGSRLFLISAEAQDRALNAPPVKDAYPDGISGSAFELLFDDPRLCRRFVKAYRELTGKGELDRVSLLDANVSVQKKTVHGAGGTHHAFTMTLFTPNGGAITQRSFSSVIRDDALRGLPLDEAIAASFADLVEDGRDIDPAGTRRMSELMSPLLRLIGDLEAGELRLGDPLNPQNLLQARIADRKRLKRERHALRTVAKRVPDLGLIPVMLPDEPDAVEELVTQVARVTEVGGWAPEGPATGEVELGDPRLRNPHGQMHPQRVRRALPWLGLPVSDLDRLSREARRTVRDLMAQEDGVGRDGVMQDQVALDLSPAVMNSVEPIMTLFQRENLSLPRESRVGLEKVQGLFHLHEALRTYLRSGSSCFQLNGPVSGLLTRTEIADIQVSDLRLPYDGVYLTFDQPPLLEIDGAPSVFEGAYLSGSGSELTVTIITRPEGEADLTLETLQPPLVIRIPRWHGLSLQDAILEALETNGYDLDRGEGISPIPAFRDAAEALGSALLIPDRSAQDRIVDRNQENFGSMVEAVTLAANALMLLTAPPEEVRIAERWVGVREETGRLLTSGSASDRARGRAEAQRENVMPIRVISLNEGAERRLRDQEAEVRKSPEEAYWRKGHWRRQAHGPGKSLRRWVWIEPVLCNAEAELRRAGSVYQKDLEETGPGPS